MNRKCSSPQNCSISSSSEKSFLSDEKSMNLCNRCPQPSTQGRAKASHRRSANAFNSGNHLQGDSCCQSFYDSPHRPCTSYRQAAQHFVEFPHNPRVFCGENRSFIGHKALISDNEGYQTLHHCTLVDECKTQLSSTSSSHGTFVVSPRIRRIKKKKKKCHGNRKPLSVGDSQSKDHFEECHRKRTPLETPEPLETVTPKKEAECIDGNVKDKPFPSGGEVKQQHSCKIDKKPSSTIPSPPSSSTSTVSMPRIEERKCCSYNDLRELLEVANKTSGQGRTIPTYKKRLKCANAPRDKMYMTSNCFKDSTKLSNYFGEKISPQNLNISSSAKLETGSRPISGGNTRLRTKRRETVKTPNEKPFQIFNLNQSLQAKTPTKCMPSSMHPVARPNLAAILRTEHSQRKLREFEKNCSYSELKKYSSLDWEIRKTDAWKALLLSDSHKDLLAMRLATRQAEQALQRREYELNMELMRQRVKSSPLLLEGGSTPWCNSASRYRVRHNCATESIVSCPRRPKRDKVSVPRSVSCCPSESNNIMVAPSEIFKSDEVPKPLCKDEQTQTKDRPENSRKCHNRNKKFRTICRIYASHVCDDPEKKKQNRSSKSSCCKCSNQRPPTPIVPCRRINPCNVGITVRRKETTRGKCRRQKLPPENESADELCSLDRALL